MAHFVRNPIGTVVFVPIAGRGAASEDGGDFLECVGAGVSRRLCEQEMSGREHIGDGGCKQ